jgi:hypothetical protein
MDAGHHSEPSPEEVQNAKNWLEKRHRIELPLDVSYSDRISSGFCVHSADIPSSASPREREELLKKRNNRLRAKGLSDSEIHGIDPDRFTIFLPKSRSARSMDIYATFWEELGHATAWALGVDDLILNESLALSYRYRGVLSGVNEGRFLLDEVASRIELEVRSVGADAALMSRLRSMGLKASRHNQLSHYDDSLFAIKEYNPKLVFRNRSPDELIAELDKSICYTLECAKKRKFKFEKYFVLSSVGVILVLVVASILDHLLKA